MVVKNIILSSFLAALVFSAEERLLAPTTTKTYDTLADMVAQGDPRTRQTVHVLGYHEKSDGGGGMFRPVNDVVRTNIGTKFASSVKNWTWERILTGTELNVRMFGAVPDDSTDNTIPFEEADQIARSLGKTVLVTAGDRSKGYRLTSTIEVSASWQGKNWPIIWMDGADGSAEKTIFEIHGYSGKGLKVSGLDLRGGYEGVGTEGEQSHAIRIGNSTNVFITDNFIEGPYGDCVYLGSISSTNLGVCENVHVIKNRLRKPRRCAVAIVSARRVFIRDNNIYDPYDYVATIDLEPNDNRVELVEWVCIENNRVESRSSFVNFYNPKSTVQKIREITIRNNKGSARFAVRALSYGLIKPNEKVTIENNTFWSTVGDERFLVISNIPYGLKIANNKDLTTGSSGIMLQNCDRPQIYENLIRPGSSGAKAPGKRLIGINFIACNGVRFSKNVIDGVYSRSAGTSVIFTGNKPSGGHRLFDNLIKNTRLGFDYEGAVITDTVMGGNQFQTGLRGIKTGSRANGSGIRILPTNIYLPSFENEMSNPGAKIAYGVGAPEKGEWATGSICFNVSFSRKTNISHWICIGGNVAGGIWQAYGNGRGSSVQRPILTINDLGYDYFDTDEGEFIRWNGNNWETVN